MGYFTIRRPLVLIIPDSFVDGLHLLCLEGRLSDDKRIENDTYRPSVDFKAMSVGGVEENLRSDVIRRAADCSIRTSVGT